MKKFWSAISIIVAFRIIIAINIPVWIDTNAGLDDLLMLRYADIFNHFTYWNTFSLAKTMSFPVFLGVSYILRISFPIAVCLLWIVGSFLALWLFKHFIKNSIGLILIFFFVLYSPVAFDLWTGLRVYRQAIIAPSALIVVLSFFLLVLKIYLVSKASDDYLKPRKILIFISIFSGFSFIFFFYIKEDGMWLVPLIIIMTVTGVFLILKNVNNFQIKTKYLVIAVLPLLIFFCGTNIYKAVNYHYFGVFEITTRNGGEFGRFAANLIKIEDENKTSIIWIPYSTLEKAWAASETLASAPEILDNLRNMEDYAGGDIINNPIPGDLMFWALKIALAEANLYNSERQAEVFFKEVNKELDAAFKTGAISKVTGISISSTVPPRTIEEIKNLSLLVWEMLKYQTFYSLSSANVNFSTNYLTPTIEEVLRVEMLSYWYDFTIKDSVFLSIGNTIIKIYRFAAPILICLAIAGYIWYALNRFRLRQKNVSPGIWGLFPIFSVSLLISVAALIIGVAWFAEWIFLSYPEVYQAVTILNYYSSGAAPLIQLLQVFGIAYLLNQVSCLLANRRVFCCTSRSASDSSYSPDSIETTSL